jgi:chaperonin GroES
MMHQFGWRHGSDRLVTMPSGRKYREGDVADMIARFNKDAGPIGQQETLMPTTTIVLPTIPGIDLKQIPNIEPRNDRVLLVRHPQDETQGGIIIPDSAQEKSKKATVLRVGPGRLLPDGTRNTIDLACGDTVLLLLYAGSDFKIDGVEFTLVEEADIIATVDKHEDTRS